MKKIAISFTLIFSCIFALNVSAAQDTELPTIESVEVLTPKVEQGGKARIKVKVSDDLSGVQQISIRFVLGETGVDFFTWVKEGSPLKSEHIIEVDINKYAELGTWSAIQASVVDFADKYNYYDTIGYGADSTPIVDASFEVIEKSTSEQPVEDNFKNLPAMNNIPVDKDFTISFNMNIDLKTLTENNIYVLDHLGYKVPLMFIIDRNSKKSTSQVTVYPVDNYLSNSSYTLYIKDIYSTNGKKLKQHTKMKFTTR